MRDLLNAPYHRKKIGAIKQLGTYTLLHLYPSGRKVNWEGGVGGGGDT